MREPLHRIGRDWGVRQLELAVSVRLCTSIAHGMGVPALVQLHSDTGGGDFSFILNADLAVKLRIGRQQEFQIINNLPTHRDRSSSYAIHV